MKLYEIHQIEEGRKIIDDEYTPGKKLWVLENAGANTIVSALDQVKDSLGGWISPHGSWIWDRDRASHFYIATTMNIERPKSASFYIIPTEKNNNKVIEAVFSDSHTGGVGEDILMESPLINAIVGILAKRKEELNHEEKDDFSDLLGSLSGADY